jgi:hypothetical protein
MRRARRTALVVTAAVTGVVGAATPATASRVYGGQPATFTDPSQLVLRLSDDGARVDGIVVHLDLRCTPRSRLGRRYPMALSLTNEDAIPVTLRPGRYALAAPPVAGGRLQLALRGEARQRATNGAAVGGRFEADVVATVSDARASGTVRATQVLRLRSTGRRLGTCTLTDRWRADRRPGRIFAGRSSQDEPVVFELSQDRRRITHGHFGWFARCRPSGTYWEPHEEFGWTSFPLRRGGSFAGRFTFDDGDQRFRYRLSGRLGRRHMSGRLSVEVRERRPSQADCAAGPVTWWASTG